MNEQASAARQPPPYVPGCSARHRTALAAHPPSISPPPRTAVRAAAAQVAHAGLVRRLAVTAPHRGEAGGAACGLLGHVAAVHHLLDPRQQPLLALPLVAGGAPARQRLPPPQDAGRHHALQQQVDQPLQAVLRAALQVDVLEQPEKPLQQVVGVGTQVQHVQPPPPGPVPRAGRPVVHHLHHHRRVSQDVGVPGAELRGGQGWRGAEGG